MGLGLHGGGVATARFCCAHGAEVTVTDLRAEEDLADSIEALSDCSIRYVLGRHERGDFASADIVFKNPAVPRTSRFLSDVNRVETDISFFLALHRGPVYGITGTKGKSTTASALHSIVSAQDASARLGGNITLSPLTFADDLNGDEPIVLELSSFQLGDLGLTPAGKTGEVPRLAVAVVTNVLADHQDYYPSMEAYASDKTWVFRGQRHDSWVLLSADDPYSSGFVPPFPNRCIRISGEQPVGTVRLPEMLGGNEVVVVPEEVRVRGVHQRLNLLFAGVSAVAAGVDLALIRERIASFPGLPHRLEHVGSIDGVAYYNDSAATIADASLAAVRSFHERVHLIAGGSDKGLSLDLFANISDTVASLHLLAGSAAPQIVTTVRAAGGSFSGPHTSLSGAMDAARNAAKPADVVLLSPGCASFGMFRNEFDRGDQFRSLVRAMAAMTDTE